ncbi:hypothetical protein [Streptomyces sp. SLBN-118]|uniref:hypothetical protein n=1 Tax=Streptomyces sp. SLBN-118 TaxID=2768454 RepID=UPI0011510609|nr:hypothetical protein [Streptomyces sp. SLBN-118]
MRVRHMVAAYRPDEAEGGLTDALAVLARKSPQRGLCAGCPSRPSPIRTMAMVELGEAKGADELYGSLLPCRDAPPPSSGFTVALRPVAYTLGELAGLLGRDEAAAHCAHAATIAERWNSPLGLRG